MPPAPFPPSYRLRSAGDFSRMRQGSDFRYRRGAMLLFASRSPSGLSPARLGIVVVKKRVRHAVCRNRIKRLVREAFRHDCQAWPSYDVVVRFHGELAYANALPPQLEADIRHLFVSARTRLLALSQSDG